MKDKLIDETTYNNMVKIEIVTKNAMKAYM